MDHFYILLPAAALFAVMVLALAVYTVLVVTGRPPVIASVKSNELFGAFWGRYIYWCTQPFERALIAGNVSPNAITALSLFASAGAGVAVAFGQLGTTVWLYALSGILDLLDGRLARALGKQTQAGALFDSVADRWAELLLFAGFGWYLRDTPWLLAAMGCSAGSMMVSYTRARVEGLGLALRGGAMQRAERIVLICVGSLLAAMFDASSSTASWAVPTAGGALALCGALSTITAVRRWIDGYRALGST